MLHGLPAACASDEAYLLATTLDGGLLAVCLSILWFIGLGLTGTQALHLCLSGSTGAEPP